MKSNPTLRGRYEGSVLSPLQWGLLAGVGYVVVLGLQVDTLLHRSFRIDLLGHEVVRVEQAARGPTGNTDHRPHPDRSAGRLARAAGADGLDAGDRTGGHSRRDRLDKTITTTASRCL